MREHRVGIPGRAFLAGLTWLPAACAAGPGAVPGPAPSPTGLSELPPIPEVRGRLAIAVEYPRPNDRLAVVDSNFVFGTVGTGDATLIIDGAFVRVEPNGAFLAWLPVPRAVAGDTARYHLIARRGAERDTLTLPVRLPEQIGTAEENGTADADLWIDSHLPSAEDPRWVLPDDVLRFSAGAAPGVDVWLEAGAGHFPLRLGLDSVSYSGSVTAGELRAAACDELSRCGSSVADTLSLALVASDGNATLRREFEFVLRVLDPLDLPVVELRKDPDPVHGGNGMVVARPQPSGPFRWRLPSGTQAVVDGRRGHRLRLRAAPDLALWVDADDAVFLPAGSRPPRSAVGDLRIEPRADELRLDVRLARPLPALVEEPDPHTLTLTLLGAVGATNRIGYGRTDPLLASADWNQLPGERYRLTLRLTEPVWGYRLAFLPAGGGTTLRLELRRPPAIDPVRPLLGRRIAVDPGHPPAGAHGPTGLYEADANLAIGRRLAELLRAAGATPILLRRDTLALGLYTRTALAEEADAELFVSIHNNALPDGVRPFGKDGTSTYYYQGHSLDLAAAVQAGMLRSMGLRDLGIFWADLAVARDSWMPAVLAEGAFIMMPRQEAALRTAAFQDAYARGVLDGIRSFLRGRDRARDRGWDGSAYPATPHTDGSP